MALTVCIEKFEFWPYITLRLHLRHISAVTGVVIIYLVLGFSYHD